MLKEYKTIIGTPNIIDRSIRSVDIGIEEVKSGNIAEGAVGFLKLDTETRRVREVIRIPADSAAGDTWERGIYFASVPTEISDVGIIPDATFGQATDSAVLTLRNRGIDGTGTRDMVSRTFSGAVTGLVYTSFGSIMSGYVASGENLTLIKTNVNSGQIVPAAAIVLNIERKY